VVARRNGQEVSLTIPAGQSIEDVFGYPTDRLVVGQVSSGMPAERSGLKTGDQILKVNGRDLTSTVEFPSLVQESQGRPMSLGIQRGDRTMEIEVRPQQVSVRNGVTRWQIGIGIQSGEMVERHLPLGAALIDSVSTNAMMARQIFYVVIELFRGDMSLKQLEGPLGIAKASGEAAKEGIGELVSLMAMIGVNLAVLNLLPIPPLDGGHILLLFIEGTIRRDLSVRVKERFVTVSMVFLLLVFAIVMYNDVLRLIPHR
jgi:regulator of sigma E protease